MGIKLINFDVSEYLDSEESIAAYLSSIIEEGDLQLLLAAISDVAKARGMSKIASDSGLGRESLYKALKPESKPRFETILKILSSLGVKIQFNAKDEIKSKKSTTQKTVKTIGFDKRKKSVTRGSSKYAKKPLKNVDNIDS